jgi:hypothetical protein
MHDLRHKLALAPLLVCTLAGCGDDGATAQTVADATTADPCISQCELAAGPCDEKPSSQFRDFVGTLEDWRTRCPESPTRRPFLVAGKCADGTSFLHLGGNYTSERRYFSTEGAFLSLATTTDVGKLPCKGSGYWPARPACESPRVTEVVCGESPWQVGAQL